MQGQLARCCRDDAAVLSARTHGGCSQGGSRNGGMQGKQAGAALGLAAAWAAWAGQGVCKLMGRVEVDKLQGDGGEEVGRGLVRFGLGGLGLLGVSGGREEAGTGPLAGGDWAKDSNGYELTNLQGADDQATPAPSMPFKALPDSSAPHGPGAHRPRLL